MSCHRLGVTHITHLSEWTDVLRLSSKWEFNDLRSATIKAMRPLASCVDRIALARTYEIAEWLPDAFEEVLAREEDLMVDEAKRIPLEDIVAIARGRREVRETRLMLPQHQVKAIVRNLLGLAPITTIRSSSIALAGKLERTTSPDALHKSDTGTPAERKMVTRWFSQHEDPASSHAAEMCLIEYTRQHAWSVPMIWGHFFSRGLQTFAHAYHDNVASFMRLAFNDAQFHYPASLVASDPSLRFLITLGQDVGLGWAKIFSKTYGDIWKMIQTLSSHDQQESATLCGFIITHTRFIDYLITQGVATTNGHRDFWRGMTYVFSVSSLSTNIVYTAQSLLKELGPCVCTLSSSLEMDEFYRAVEWNRAEAQKAGLVELGGSLKVCLELWFAENIAYSYIFSAAHSSGETLAGARLVQDGKP
jgi:hypothetical protein